MRSAGWIRCGEAGEVAGAVGLVVQWRVEGGAAVIAFLIVGVVRGVFWRGGRARMSKRKRRDSGEGVCVCVWVWAVIVALRRDEGEIISGGKVNGSGVDAAVGVGLVCVVCVGVHFARNSVIDAGNVMRKVEAVVSVRFWAH